MKPIILTVDENQILDAAIEAAAKTIGSTVMTRENCEVTFKKGRKTKEVSDPKLEVTVEFYPQGKPGAQVAEPSQEAPVASEEPEVSETTTESEEDSTEEAKPSVSLFNS